MSIPTREEIKQERYFDDAAEDAANAAETQAWTWHRKRHDHPQVKQYGGSVIHLRDKCNTYEAVRYALVAGVAGMSVERQLDYLVNGRTRKRL